MWLHVLALARVMANDITIRMVDEKVDTALVWPVDIKHCRDLLNDDTTPTVRACGVGSGHVAFRWGFVRSPIRHYRSRHEGMDVMDPDLRPYRFTPNRLTQMRPHSFLDAANEPI